MPAVTRGFIKLSLVYLLLALALQGLLAARGGPARPAWLVGLEPVYFHLFLVGWVTQLIFGVVYWLFPKWSKERPQGYEGLAWTSLVLLNLGLLLRAVGEPALAAGDGSVGGAGKAAVVLSALLQGLAGLAFVVNTWRRVR